MTNKNDSRRKLLKSIAAGSGAVVAGKSLPESWSKPVVNAVMLPAHAATTTPTPLPTSYSDGFTFRGQIGGQNSPLDNVLSVLVQDAHAGGYKAFSGSMCVDTSNAPTFTAKVLVSTEGGTMKVDAITQVVEEGPIRGLYETTSGTIGSAAGVNLQFKDGCDSFGTINIAILSNDADGAAYKVTVNSGNQVASGSAPEGTDCPEGPVDCILEE